MRKRIFDIIQIGNRSDWQSRLFDYFIVAVIVISISITFALTFELPRDVYVLLDRIELVTILIFIVEYVLRLCTVDFLYPNYKTRFALFRFIFSFYGIVDLLSIVSYFAPLYSNGIVALRMIRVIRIMRLFQVNRSFDAFSVIAEVLAEKRRQLTSSIFTIAMIMLAASLVMYGLEHEVQPEVFDNGFSGIWWAMSTILTVGYGDIYPITFGGRLVAIIIAILGVCVVAIPTGVISAGFVEYYARIREKVVGDHTMFRLQKEARERDMSAEQYVIYLMDKEDGKYKSSGG